MPRFAYKATNQDGAIVDGHMEGANNGQITEMLKQRGLVPVSVTEIKVDTDERLTKARIAPKPLSQFCKQLATVLHAGVPISTAMELLCTQIEDKALKMIIEDVYTKILSGRSIYEAFYTYRDNFPTLFFNMIEAGESSGRLDECLERAADTFMRQAKLNGRVKAAMVYPCVLLVLTIAITLVLMVFVVPQFVDLFVSNGAGDKLPALTKVVMGISNFIIKFWYILILVAVGIVVAIILFLRNTQGRLWWDENKLRLPVIGKNWVKICTARFARTLITLISAGIPLTNALDVAGRSIGNKHMEGRISGVIENVRMGQTMSSQISKAAIFPQMLSQMIRLGEESGEIEPLLDNCAEFYEEESDNAIASMMAMMEPALIVLLGVLILPTILGIIMPTFTLYEAIG